MFRKSKRSASKCSASRSRRVSSPINRRDLAVRRRLIFETLEDKRMLSFTWSGAGSNNNWSNAANWVGGVAPGSGASLIFSGTTRTSTTDDLASGTAINSIELSSNNFTLAGNSIAAHLATSRSIPA